MDLLVLRRLTAELDEMLRGRRIEQVWALPKSDVVIAVGRRSGPRLWFSAEPDDPHLYLRTGAHATPQRPPGFAMAARGVLVGRRIAALKLVQADRIVELACGGDDAPRVILELIPRRATMLVVDQNDIVRAVWKPRRGRPALGDVYSPPAVDRRTPVGDIDDATWNDLRSLPDRHETTRGLLRTVAGMSPLLAREIVHRHDGGTPLPRAAHDEIARATEAPSAPRIYAPAPLGELTELPAARRFLLAPYPLLHLDEVGGFSVDPHPTLVDAAAEFYPRRACLSSLQSGRETLAAALHIGAARAQRAIDAVSGDADNAGDADEHRRCGDLLLAYPAASTQGSTVRVPDLFADDDAHRDIEIDPSMSLVDNAQAYYRRARRAERGLARTMARREMLQRRREKLEALRRTAREAQDLPGLLRAARRARSHEVNVDTGGWIPPECPQSAPAAAPGRAASPRREAPDAARDIAVQAPASNRAPSPNRRAGKAPAGKTPAGVDAYMSSDGFEILVGRSAKGNEKVTHKIASPHDFWLHAEGPGSHVVIRNPTRRERPSDDSLRQAASLAAWFSRSRGATKVNVRWTQARQVKKPRGAPTGQVVLRQSHSFLAEPLPPDRLFADEEND